MNLFVFQFNCLGDRKWVLEGGPWAFDKHMLVLKEVNGLRKISEEVFRWAPLRIQLYNLPLACLCKDMGVVLGEMIGRMKKVDSSVNGGYLGNCLRVRVGVDISKLLTRGLRMALGWMRRFVLWW
ncbi:hypothetical protein ACOSP7_016768 [Xanthoceras sorbifolium]